MPQAERAGWSWLAVAFLGLAADRAIAAGLEPELAATLDRAGKARVLVVLAIERPPAPVGDGARGSGERAWLASLQARFSERVGALAPGLPPDADPRELWGADTLAVTLDAATAREWARRPEVEALLADREVELPRTFAGSAKTQELGPVAWGLARLGVPEVWARYGLRGRGQRIGVIDTGIDAAHPDLAGRIERYRDFASPATEPQDPVGHGTHVAGTLVGGDGYGTAIGVAPEARLLVARALGGSWGGRESLLAAMQWMLDPDGDPATDDRPAAVSMSWHSGPGDQKPFYRMVDSFVASGIFPCFSAGNMGPDGGLTNPKRYAASRSAGAVDEHDQVAKFSSRGPVKEGLTTIPKPDWAAPGVDVFSSVPGGGWRHMSGTSMAAPHVAGVVALLRQARPELTVEALVATLAGTARDLAPAGWDGATGAGAVDALAAVASVARVGTLELRVSVAGGGAAGGATARTEPGGARFEADLEGMLRVELPPGTHRLRVEAFGCLPGGTSVTVVEGEVVSAGIELAGLPSHPVEIRVVDLSGAPIPDARLTWLGTPLAESIADASGQVSCRLPTGSHGFRVQAAGYAPGFGEVRVPGSRLEIRLRPRAGILLVDDDEAKKLDRFVFDAFEVAGLEVDHWDRSRSPLTTGTLAEYPVAVWMTGGDSRDTLTALDQGVVSAYLAGGGKLVLTGQDLAYDLRGSDFLQKTLGGWFDRDDSGIHRVTGLGMDFRIEGGDGAQNQESPDQVYGLSGLRPILFYPQEYPKPAGVARPGRIVLLGFGLEAVTPVATRAELLVRLLAIAAGQDPGVAAAALDRRRRQVRGFGGRRPARKGDP